MTSVREVVTDEVSVLDSEVEFSVESPESLLELVPDVLSVDCFFLVTRLSNDFLTSITRAMTSKATSSSPSFLSASFLPPAFAIERNLLSI